MFFYNRWILLLLLLVLFAGIYVKLKRKEPGFYFSSLELCRGLGSSFKALAGSNLVFLRCIALAFIVCALARPQSPVLDSLKRTEGIDIVLAIDASTSMLAEDFMLDNKRANRADVLKKVIPDFIEARPNDRIGATVFASEAYVLSPLTINHNWLLQNIERLDAGRLGNRTAMGNAIALSLTRLEGSKAKSKVVVLLTDGRSNAGDVAPLAAAEMARALNIKVYAIGVGEYGVAPFPVFDDKGTVLRYDSLKLDLDEDVLRQIASITGAKYFRATDTKTLKETYKEIDRMEKVPLQERGYDEYNELFPVFLIPGLIILLAEILLSNTILRKTP